MEKVKKPDKASSRIQRKPADPLDRKVGREARLGSLQETEVAS
jgi:hypothetical protein